MFAKADDSVCVRDFMWPGINANIKVVLLYNYHTFTGAGVTIYVSHSVFHKFWSRPCVWINLCAKQRFWKFERIGAKLWPVPSPDPETVWTVWDMHYNIKYYQNCIYVIFRTS